VLDDGTVLFDSPVICEHLDTLGNGPKFFPAGGAERLRALRLNALADGLLDAAMAARMETMRPAEKQWDKWSEVQLLKVRNALDAMTKAYAPSREAITIGEIAAGCALGWLDSRMPQLNWREGRDQLAAWFAEFSKRPSMSSTAPKAS
jgi:glutathione S-transferase